MSETGSVKFHYTRTNETPVRFAGLADLNRVRRRLLQLRLLGVDEQGVGFGNMSVRDPAGGFFITGSNTGARATLGPEHIARVTAFALDRNWLSCEGAAVASSESLTHAAIYSAAPAVSAVIHGHSDALWRELRERAPTTSAEVEYGTPAMAREVLRLFAAAEVKARRLFIMAGHAEGVVAFGADLEEALQVLVRALAA